MAYTSKYADKELAKASKAAAANAYSKPKSMGDKMKSSAKSGSYSSTKKPASSSAKQASKGAMKESGRRGRIAAMAKYNVLSNSDKGINITASSAQGVAKKAKKPKMKMMKTMKKMSSETPRQSQSKPYK